MWSMTWQALSVRPYWTELPELLAALRHWLCAAEEPGGWPALSVVEGEVGLGSYCSPRRFSSSSLLSPLFPLLSPFLHILFSDRTQFETLVSSVEWHPLTWRSIPARH